MKSFKRWVVRLLDIGPEDLGESRDSQIASELKVVIEQEVKHQLESILPRLLNSVLDQFLKEKGFEVLSTNQVSGIGSEGPKLEQREPQIGDVDEKLYKKLDGKDVSPTNNQGALGDSAGKASLLNDQSESLAAVHEADKSLTTSAPTFGVPSTREKARGHRKRKKPKPIRLGIDFGTTTTAISIKIGDSLPEALPIGEDGSTRYMPSVVYFRPGSGSLDERVIVGEPADNVGDSVYVIRSIKRCLGCEGQTCVKEGGGGRFAWCQGNGKVAITENEFIEPQRIVYYIIREALQRAVRVVRDQYKIDLSNSDLTLVPVNLGCSAKFNYRQREIIRKVALELGLNRVGIENVIEEPILAGFAFSRFAENPLGRYLIYDFGGGTFDAAILEVDREENDLRVTIIATAGDNWLGGDDIDRLIYNYFLQKNSHNTSPEKLEKSLSAIDQFRLLNCARRAKEKLSYERTYSERCGQLDLALSREEFNRLLEDSKLIERSIEVLKQACQLAYAYENACKGNLLQYEKIVKLSLEEASQSITYVVLVGGVTKIPYIRERLERVFGRNKIVSEGVIDPIDAVAVGGSYPLNRQHYSLNAPPCEFFIKARRVQTKEEITIPVFEPYEHLDFHQFWHQNAYAAYHKKVYLEHDLEGAHLYHRYPGEKKAKFQSLLGRLSTGYYNFYISLEGKLYYWSDGSKPRDLGSYPLIHPIQKRIIEAKEQRLKNQPQVKGDYDDWIKGMMTEN